MDDKKMREKVITATLAINDARRAGAISTETADHIFYSMMDELETCKEELS